MIVRYGEAYFGRSLLTFILSTSLGTCIGLEPKQASIGQASPVSGSAPGLHKNGPQARGINKSAKSAPSPSPDPPSKNQSLSSMPKPVPPSTNQSPSQPAPFSLDGGTNNLLPSALLSISPSMNQSLFQPAFFGLDGGTNDLLPSAPPPISESFHTPFKCGDFGVPHDAGNWGGDDFQFNSSNFHAASYYSSHDQVDSLSNFHLNPTTYLNTPTHHYNPPSTTQQYFLLPLHPPLSQTTTSQPTHTAVNQPTDSHVPTSPKGAQPPFGSIALSFSTGSHSIVQPPSGNVTPPPDPPHKELAGKANTEVQPPSSNNTPPPEPEPPTPELPVPESPTPEPPTPDGPAPEPLAPNVNMPGGRKAAKSRKTKPAKRTPLGNVALANDTAETDAQQRPTCKRKVAEWGPKTVANPNAIQEKRRKYVFKFSLIQSLTHFA